VSAAPTSAQSRVDRLDTAPSARGQGHGGSDRLQLSERTEALRDKLEARADSRLAGEVRADVTEARQAVKGWDSSSVSAKTESRYEKAVETMRESGARPEAAGNRATFEFNRSALVHCTRKSVKTALRDLDKAKRAGSLDKAADAYARVKTGLQTLRDYPPSSGDRQTDMQRKSAFSGPRSGGASKRYSLDNLPAGWRDSVQREAAKGDRPALGVMALTGCRPAEVRGMRVTQDKAAGTVTFSIHGAKVDDARGVELREITLQKDELQRTQTGRDVAEWLGNRDVRTVTHSGDTSNFCNRISAACDRAALPAASAYSYRHQTARDLKTSGLEKSEIADRLGHRSARSQADYG